MKVIKLSIASLLLTLSMSSAAFASFKDVDKTETYQKGIEYLQELGIVNGYPDGTYGPETDVNRAEMLKIVLGAVGVTDEDLDLHKNEECFADVPKDAWFTKYVCYAKAEGFVSGYEDNTFRPANPVNVVEAIKIVLEIFEIPYVQDADVWYKGIINAASEKNYIPHTVTSFGGNFKRNQMADLIARILKDEQGQLADYLGPRSILVVTYATMDMAVNKKSWNIDPNSTSLIATTIITSEVDPDKVVTILQTLNENANDPSIANIPMVKLYSDDVMTYFYTTSVHCILTNDCSDKILSKIDNILFEALWIMDTFSFGNVNEDQNVCFYVSNLDFSLDFPGNKELPNNWAPISELVILDQEYWGVLGDYQGQGVICGDEVDSDSLNGDTDLNGKKIILEAKEPGTPQEELDDLEYALDLWLTAPEDDMIFGNPTQENYQYYLDWLAKINQEKVKQDDLVRVLDKLDQFENLLPQE